MRRLVLDGHYGQRVEIDLCAPCHLVWFDAVESVRLAGTGMLALLGEMAGAQREPHQPLRRDARCPRCAGALKTIHNRSRWGATLQWECLRRHGAYQTFAQFLSEKGLVRPLSSADRAGLIRRGGALHCLNCGAGLDVHDTRCRYCDSLPGIVDVARLAHALDPEGAIASQPVHATAPQHAAFHCLACGAPLAPGEAMQCGQCGATLAVSQLAQAHEAVRVLEQALRESARAPSPAVKARRLQALEGDLSRRREWAREMEAQARAEGEATGRAFWDDVAERPWHVVAAAALLLFVFFLFYA